MKRNPVFDLMKCVAITLVVMQHFMMKYGLGMNMMDVWPGKMITLVNMPLFIFMSGWFAGSLHNKSLCQLVTSRYKTLLRPTIVYSIFSAVVCGLIMGTLPSTVGGAEKFIVHSLISSYWFIWVIIYCTIATWVVFFICRLLRKDKPALWIEVLLMISVLIRSFFIRNGLIPWIHHFKAMFPFFILGYWMGCIDLFEKLRKYAVLATTICIILYLIASFIFHGVWSFYYFGSTPLPQLIIYYALMIVVGFSGIIAIYYILEYCVERYSNSTGHGKCLLDKSVEIGVYTLSIYMIQGVLMDVLTCYSEQVKISSNWANYGLSLISTIVFMVIVYHLILVFLKNKWTSRYLLGKESLHKVAN